MLAEWARGLLKQRRGLPVILPETIVRRHEARETPPERSEEDAQKTFDPLSQSGRGRAGSRDTA